MNPEIDRIQALLRQLARKVFQIAKEQPRLVRSFAGRHT
jgi:hypothetical protein